VLIQGQVAHALYAFPCTHTHTHAHTVFS